LHKYVFKVSTLFLTLTLSFIAAQTIFIALGVHLLTGAIVAFSIATSMTVVKPKTWADGSRYGVADLTGITTNAMFSVLWSGETSTQYPSLWSRF